MIVQEIDDDIHIYLILIHLSHNTVSFSMFINRDISFAGTLFFSQRNGHTIRSLYILNNN